MQGEGPRSQTTNVFGWESIREENALIHLARQVPANGTIVELGGEYGRSASQFAYALKIDNKQGHVYTVDMFPVDHPVVGNLQKAWYANITEAGFRDYCTPIRGTTLEGAVIWNEHKTPIDLLFIDAGHTYEDVKADIAAWSDFVKQGGVMAFHDYAQNPDAHPLHWEVKRAVDEWHESRKAEWVRYSGPDSLVWFVRAVQPVTVVGSFKTTQVATVGEVTSVTLGPGIHTLSKVLAPKEDQPSDFETPVPVTPKENQTAIEAQEFLNDLLETGDIALQTKFDDWKRHNQTFEYFWEHLTEDEKIRLDTIVTSIGEWYDDEAHPPEYWYPIMLEAHKLNTGLVAPIKPKNKGGRPPKTKVTES